jgi:hypothetical protein
MSDPPDRAEQTDPPEDLPVPSSAPGSGAGRGRTPRLTLTGRHPPGTEPGCLLLQGYLLVGGPRDLLTGGGRVRVTGQLQPDLMTTCQQGTPLVVESARPA